MENISEQFYLSGYTWHYDRIVKTPTHKLRVLIVRNSYDHQSSLEGQVLGTEMKWNRLVLRPIQNSNSHQACYTNKREDITPFQKDADSILDEMIAILS